MNEAMLRPRLLTNPDGHEEVVYLVSPEQLGNITRLLKPEVKGTGAITYRCAECKEPIESEPVFVPELPLTPDTKTYHQECLDGR